MPQDTPDAISPLAPFEGSYQVPGYELTQRWLDARDLTPELRDEIIKIIRIAFNNRASWFALPVAPEDHFDWKFRDRPTGATAHLTIDGDDRIVGFIGGVRRIWLLKGRPVVSRAGQDLSLLPQWQGRGYQRALQPFDEREWHPSEDMRVGYVNHPTSRHIASGFGYKAPANETHDYLRLLRPFQRLRTFLSRARVASAPTASTQLSNTSRVIRARERRRANELLQRAHRSASFVVSLFTRRPAPRTHWTISTITSFEEHHEPFITEALSQFDFVADRSIPYLNWRFCDERAGPYTVRLAQQDGQPLGYAVTQMLDGQAHVADILALPGQPTVAESLIRDAVDLAKRAGVNSIRSRLPKRHPYRSALARAGFFDIGHVAGELVAPRRMSAAELDFLNDEDTRIHAVLADSD